MNSPAADIPPRLLAHRYDPEYDAVHLIEADRALRHQVPFLIDDYLPGAKTPTAARRIDCLKRVVSPSPIHFIFHSAYCCSTLLANALDVAGVASSFKEPLILNDIVGWRHRGGEPEKVGNVLDSALTLLSRPFEQGEASIIKPSNLVNALAPAMLSMRPEAGCLLLYARLRTFLASIADKGLWGRRWVRDLLMKQLKDGIVDLGFTPEDHFLHTDLQVAAVGWLAQHRLFAQLADKWPERVRTLDSDVLLARKTEAIAAIADLFGLTLNAAAASQGEAFSRNAKSGAPFDSEAREAEKKHRAEMHADEIGKVVIWAEAVAQSAGVRLELPVPLLG